MREWDGKESVGVAVILLAFRFSALPRSIDEWRLRAWVLLAMAKAWWRRLSAGVLRFAQDDKANYFAVKTCGRFAA
jgi:hypothetical protein